MKNVDIEMHKTKVQTKSMWAVLLLSQLWGERSCSSGWICWSSSFQFVDPSWMSIPDMVMEKRPKGIGQGVLLELSGQADMNLPQAQHLSRWEERWKCWLSTTANPAFHIVGIHWGHDWCREVRDLNKEKEIWAVVGGETENSSFLEHLLKSTTSLPSPPKQAQLQGTDD